MGDILNPVDGNSFIDLVEAKNTRIFVDKTDFIAKTNALLNTDGKLLALTRPRRFGKTVTADMLLAYYSKAYAGQNIFAGLKITDNESLTFLIPGLISDIDSGNRTKSKGRNP